MIKPTKKTEDITKEDFLAFQNGDENVFEDIFNINYNKVKAFILHLIKNETEAEDKAQDVFVKIWTNRQAIRSYNSFYGYMYQLARNEAFDFLAQNKRSKNFIYEIPEYIHAISSPDLLDAYQTMELEIKIYMLVSEMPEQRRKIFYMSRKEGMSYDDISKTLNISKKTIESHINTALNQIRKMIFLYLLLQYFR